MGDISKDIQSSFVNAKVKALINIMYTSNWIHANQTTFFKPFGISNQQFNILRILRGAKAPLKVQEIKKRMIDRAPNATRLMDKLKAKQLIDRKPCPDDRRVVYIEITDLGLELLQEISSKMNFDLLEKLSEEEASILSDLLDKIR